MARGPSNDDRGPASNMRGRLTITRRPANPGRRPQIGYQLSIYIKVKLSIGKWIVNVFIISEKIGYSGERFRSGNEEYSSFQRRLVTLENVFDREMKSIHHFREDWLLWRTFSIGKWRVSECIHHFREDWLLWRTFSIGKWIVNVFIISDKIGYSGERFRSGNEEWVNVFIISDKIGYSGERFRPGNELWMYSSFQIRLVTLENVFDREMKSIHHFREDWLLWRTFSIGKWVNVLIISEKIGFSGERFRSGNEWMYSNILRDLLKT